MNPNAQKVISVALAELGYREKASNAQLDDPLANAGSGNWTKYARDLAAAGYYNGDKNGFAWCDVFVDWCFYMAFGRDPVLAQRIQCQTGDYGAGCIFSMQYYRHQRRCDRNPLPGDQIFFYVDGTVGHTGLVVEVTPSVVVTVEGNSADRVQKLTYSRTDSRIAGYGHPRFDLAPANTAAGAEAPVTTATAPVPTPQTCNVPLPLLKQGAAGTAVESAQLLLIHRGYDCGGRKFLGRETPDGDFGPATEKAVRSFQAAYSLEPDGEIGADTWKSLLTG